MPDRPPIPVPVKRAVLVESCHRCAVCGFALSIEIAHIIPWSEKQEHKAENLIALCANCHEMADKQGWKKKDFEAYKKNPWALRQAPPAPLSAPQKAMVDLILARDAADMTEQQKVQLVQMVAAYVGILAGSVTLIRDKAEIMVDHFLEQVIGQNKIGGQARAMVVTGSIKRAIDYYFAFTAYLKDLKSPYKAIVAFSGEPEYKGQKVSETKLNGFPSREIEDRIEEDPYRFLICAEKFQTGYDEPLLHTMYVDKPLSGIRAVQTLSRLNRAHPKKHDVFILDFQNNAETIEHAFADYYRTTILSEETDPNKLHTIKGELDGYQVYSPEQIESLVSLYLGGADRDTLDPILDACVAVYIADLDEDGQVDFKGKAKTFTRTYDFLATILPYGVPAWEKLSMFLNFLIPKLPAPKEEDLSKGILESIDMDSYRAEKKATMAITLPDTDAEIAPAPMHDGGAKPEPELDKLSNILKAFNEQFGGLFTDSKRMEHRITEEIPQRVSADTAYQNAKKHPDRQNARIEHDKALQRVITALFKDDAQLFKQFQDNDSFRHWLADTVFGLTYEQ